MKSPIGNIEEAITAFIEGARRYHQGLLLESNKKMIDALHGLRDAIDFIDTHRPNARDILLPLLEHKEDSVRITAASGLTASHPELARSVIDHIHQTCITEAFTSAAGILTFYEVCGDYVSSLCKPDPRYPIPRNRNL